MRWRTLDKSPPKIIAHRGASGVLPEHTLQGYQLALDQGADLIEPDLVPSGDRVLFARHDAGLGRSTDIASRPDFAARSVDGDWRCQDLSASEMDGLRAVQPFECRSHADDGRFAVPRWLDVLRWAEREAIRREAPVVLYPELKHPEYFLAEGIDVAGILATTMPGHDSGARIRVQCIEPRALKQVWEATGLPCSLVVDRDSDWRRLLHDHAGWVTGLVADKRLIAAAWTDGDNLIEVAHEAGVRVDAWTYRDDQLGAGWSDAWSEMGAAMEAGVDGLFCDFPATGLRVRDWLGQG